jgi:nitrate/TMAO reductase-like tetraheme cytochrome c subunit
MTGFSPAHDPAAIGCAACHGGDRSAPDAARAHRGMILIPGNLADAARTCGTAGCHDTIVPRVEHSLMATLAGLIANDRRAFGETSATSALPPHVRDLGHSPADTHLRQLCVSCHLGAAKTDFGPLTTDSRGGGCNACHLAYSTEAAADLAHYQATPPAERIEAPTFHPRLTVAVTNDACFGCHSRSSRISLSYEGWHELREPPVSATSDVSPLAPRLSPPALRVLDDGRVFTRAADDVHHARGLDCVDCHSAREVMGDGRTHAHADEAVSLRCEDCHATKLASQPVTTALDGESALIAALRGQSFTPDQRLGVTRTGDPLMNVLVDADGRGQLRRKRTGDLLPLTPPDAACARDGAHSRLACSACHTAWAPRCASCHTSFDPSAEGFDHLAQTATHGAWMESSGPFCATPPTLGLRAAPTAADPQREVVDTFVPGMITDLDRNTDASKPADRVFRRLYARIAAHTTQRESRTCTSCHNNPVALGFGEGKLRFETASSSSVDAVDSSAAPTSPRSATTTTAAPTGRWRFTPAHAASPADGLPEDAWTGFLAARAPGDLVSPRDGQHPFSVADQQRILTVGACLTCHAGDSPPMRAALTDFSAVLARRSLRCVFPSWTAPSTPAPR